MSRLAANTKLWNHFDMLRFNLHAFIVLSLTVLTQIGGVAWLLALAFRRRLIAFICLRCADDCRDLGRAAFWSYGVELL